MNVCIPIEEDQGLESSVCPHFGSAPLFMIVNVDSKVCRAIPNENPHHSHGMCQPLASLAGEEVDAVVVGGVGLGALRKLRAANIEVFLSDRPTVGETVDAFKEGSLHPVTSDIACGHHGAGPHGRGLDGCPGATTGFGRGGGPRGQS